MAAVQGFEHRKQTFLAKCDKSSAGEIDEKAREICAEINARPAFFTTSSCAGRAFIWRGDGVKSTECFSRWRVTHDLVEDGVAYFDLGSLDNVGVPDIRDPGHEQPIWKEMLGHLATLCTWCQSTRPAWQGRKHQRQERIEVAEKHLLESNGVYWLRFEPFILHVCCRDLVAAAALMAAARSVFKNVGLQGLDSSKLIVAIWGDEGLDMPLSGPEGVPLFKSDHGWLKSLVNSRHQRNWAKIDRFTTAIRQMEEPVPSAEPNGDLEDKELRHFDVVGDIAVVNVKPKEELALVGNAILKQDRRVKVVAIKIAPLASELRAPAELLQVIAGRPRSPLMTTHIEFGVRMIIDLDACFFSPRLAGERQRLCQQVQPGERILVAFAGCGPEVLQILSHTEAVQIAAVELNSAAVRCLQRSLQIKEGQKICPVEVFEGDIRQVAKGFPPGHFHRILAPRPKNPGDGDLEQGDGGAEFLQSLLPLLAESGVCHWYDFAADWELPSCERTCKVLQAECSALGLNCNILRVAAANRRTIAERQYKVVADFQVSKNIHG